MLRIATLLPQPASSRTGPRHLALPLTDAALAILNALKPDDVRGRALGFPAPRGGSLSDMTMGTVLKRMQVEVTTHVFQSSFRDRAGDETQHDRRSIKLSLELPPSATEGAYHRCSTLAKRRELMND